MQCCTSWQLVAGRCIYLILYLLFVACKIQKKIIKQTIIEKKDAFNRIKPVRQFRLVK